MGRLFTWLFTDAATEAGGKNGDPTPFNVLPWLIVCGLALLVAFYYYTEARRNRWIKDHLIWKQYVLDRMMPQAAIWGGVGLLVIFFRWAVYYSLFAWRIWMVAWIIWGAVIVGYWAWYFITKHNSLIVSFERNVERQKYLPSRNNAKRRSTTAR